MGLATAADQMRQRALHTAALSGRHKTASRSTDDFLALELLDRVSLRMIVSQAFFVSSALLSSLAGLQLTASAYVKVFQIRLKLGVAIEVEGRAAFW